MSTEPSLTQAIAAIVAPLTTTSPVAADERYLDLRQEIGKLSALAGDPVDWPRVVDLGATLLGEVGKDLLVASYTALALHELHGLVGLAAGLGAIAQLLQTQAEGLTPARTNTRASAIDWLIDRLKAKLGDRIPTPAEAGPLRAVEGALRDLQAACRERLGDRTPGFRSLLEVVESLLLTLPSATPLTSDTDRPPPIDDEHVDQDMSSRSCSSAGGAAKIEPDPPVQSLTERTARWLLPIDPGAPCGADPHAHASYGELREEMARLSAVSAGVIVDWTKVRRLADELLRTHAKDLQVAAWMAIAKGREDGVAGLALGLATVAEVTDAFWPDIYPRRPRPRKDTAQWLVSQADAILSSATLDALRTAEIADLETAVERLGGVLRERLGDDAPGLRPLRESINQIRVDLEARATAKASQAGTEVTSASTPMPAASLESVATTDATPKGAAGPAAQPGVAPSVAVAASVAAPADLAEIDAFLTSTGQALVSTARALREAQPSDPRSYRLLRTGLWLHLVAAPAPRADGNTGISGLAERDREQLDALHSGEKWAGLLARSENLLVNHRLSLDLHRFSAAALTGMGPDHSTARLALQAELRALLTRLPTLPELRSSDGSPLADPQTQRWIATEIFPRGGAHPASIASDDDDPEFWPGLRERLRHEERAAAFAEAQAKIDGAPSGQRRFLDQLELAEACESIDEPRLAAALLLALADASRTLDLDAWDPALALRCLGGLARAQHRCGDPDGARVALGRIGRIHAPSAVDLLRELV